MPLTRDQFAAWLTGYIEAWRSRDPEAIGELFSQDCVYSYRGGHDVVSGREAIVADWLKEDEGRSWEAAYEPLAIDQEIHVAIGQTRYFDEASNVHDDYSNIFVCRFDEAARCSQFSEWWVKLPSPVERLDRS